MWTTWLTPWRNIMPGLDRLTYEDMAFIGIVLEGFCYGESFCPALIIGMINYSCLGLYSAIFFIYMQYHISKEFSIEKRNIKFLYALGVLYTLSCAIIALDVTDHVAVSKLASIITIFFFTLLYGQENHPTTPLAIQQLRWGNVEGTIIGLCDFISQTILVCINL